jgi:beta-phosphoglucomutase-like phosphatase (HAD superfamily)
MRAEFRGIIFDLDGVIADTHAAHESAWRALLHEWEDRDVSNDELRKIVRQGRTRSEILKSIFPGLSKEDEIAIGNRKNALYYENSGHLAPISGVFEWINELSQLSVVLGNSISESFR